MRTLAILLLAVSIVSVGCGKKRENRGSVRVRGDTGSFVGNNGPGSTVPGPGGTQLERYGDITNYRTDDVKALVSATMNPDEDMRLPIHGIGFEGNISVNGGSVLNLGAGQSSVNGGASNMVVWIIDDLTVRENIEPIGIGFRVPENGAQIQGTVGNGIANLTFSDNYGTIRLNGNYNSQYYQGTIEFRNNDGLRPNQNIVLGNFRIQTCAFFRCQ